MSNKWKWFCVGVLVIFVAASTAWYLWGVVVGGVVFNAGAMGLAAAVKNPSTRPVVDHAADDAQEDVERLRRAERAAQEASDEASEGWSRDPIQKRPRLDLLILCALLPARQLQAQDLRPPIAAIRCVPYADYGPLRAGAGFGVWPGADGPEWCPCLRSYGEVNRLPEGCPVLEPLLGYSLEAHQAVAADMAKASTLTTGLRFVLKVTRGELSKQDGHVKAQKLALKAGLVREVSCIANLAVQENKARSWVTLRSVLLSVGTGIALSYGTYRICSWKGC